MREAHELALQGVPCEVEGKARLAETASPIVGRGNALDCWRVAQRETISNALSPFVAGPTTISRFVLDMTPASWLGSPRIMCLANWASSRRGFDSSATLRRGQPAIPCRDARPREYARGDFELMRGEASAAPHAIELPDSLP